MHPKHLSPVLLSLTLVACGDKGEEDTAEPLDSDDAVDADDDGYTDDVDCDDGDPAVHPDADELCNGEDDDCDTQIDEDAVDAGTWHPDADEDGHGSGDTSLAVVSCEAPEGHVDSADDCLDDDPSVSPSAEEVCDGIDNDCDDSVDEELLLDLFTDADGDGHGDPGAPVQACELEAGLSEGDGDCDDTDGSVYPEAPEVCGDGVVNDCLGSVEAALAECPLEWPASDADADVALDAGTAYGEAGRSLAAGDVDGDGLDDILVGAPYHSTSEAVDQEGAAWLVLGGVSASGSLEAVAASSVTGGSRWAYLGHSLDVAPDLDGDGLDDILIGAPAVDNESPTGAAYVVLGGATADLSAPDGTFAPGVEGQVGFSVAGVGDVDGDGLGDLLVGSPTWYVEGYTGRAFLLLGPATGSTSNADATFTTVDSGTNFVGEAVSAAGDVDGDGMADLLVGGGYAASGGSYKGKAWLLAGSSSIASGDLEDLALLEVRGDADYDYLGSSLVGLGDFDGDGLDDVVLGADGADPAETSTAGAAYVFLGGTTGTVSASSAAAVVEGSTWYGRLGQGLAAGGDLDRDGLDDVLLGAPNDYNEGAEVSGRVYALLGGTTGTVSAADLPTIQGSDTTGGLGYALAGGDVDGDGLQDVVAGVPGRSDTEWSREGGVVLFLGEHTY